MTIRTAACVALSLLLAGCAARPVRDALPPVAGAPEAYQRSREAALQAIPRWSLEGRVAVSNGRDGGSGRMDWLQDGERYELSLSAPVTRQSWRLHGDAAGATLSGLEGGDRSGPDAAALLREATRWDIPVAALAQWVRAMPADATVHGNPRLVYGADGRLAAIEQAGWRIDYADWTQPPAGPALPARLNARKADASVRLVVDAWGVQPAPAAP